MRNVKILSMFSLETGKLTNILFLNKIIYKNRMIVFHVATKREYLNHLVKKYTLYRCSSRIKLFPVMNRFSFPEKEYINFFWWMDNEEKFNSENIKPI